MCVQSSLEQSKVLVSILSSWKLCVSSLSSQPQMGHISVSVQQHGHFFFYGLQQQPNLCHLVHTDNITQMQQNCKYNKRSCFCCTVFNMLTVCSAFCAVWTSFAYRQEAITRRVVRWVSFTSSACESSSLKLLRLSCCCGCRCWRRPRPSLSLILHNVIQSQSALHVAQPQSSIRSGGPVSF